MVKKIMVEGSEARAKLLRGATAVGRVVGSTLGPKGRNVIIQEAYSAPQIINDGVTVARKIVLEDPIEDLGAQTVVEATMKTNDRAGDGTTTTAVIAGALIDKCAKDIAKTEQSSELTGVKSDVVEMSRKIMESKDKVIASLKEIAKPAKEKDVTNIISTSIGKLYPEYVGPIAEIINKVGKEGYISIEDNFGTKYGVETVIEEGIRFLGSWASQSMITDVRYKKSVWNEAKIIVCNHRLDSLANISQLMQRFLEEGLKSIVIVAEGFEKSFTNGINTYYASIVERIQKGETVNYIKLLAIKAPSLTTEQFEDVATFCGARFMDKNAGGTNLNTIPNSYLGSAKKVVVDEDDTHITGGAGDVKERLATLTAQLEIEKDIAFKEQLKRRIGALASGFAFIRVGASTETERRYLKLKIEDAVYAAKAALEEGYVKGGGLVLKAIAEELGKDNILYDALMAPYKRIRENAGGDIEVPATVIDPVKVTRFAVENACSVAAQLITAEVAIADTRRTLWDELDGRLAPRDTEDFRADENQELKYRT